ncbi:gamma-glutamyltransferase [Nitrospina watsonii]|uniref:Glutathione hydrolase proenzyme n=1 Tax=Nitrospina watsonii TaxID=1323948 RepID=A0ABN8W0H9_9BACT|nr:gamma-glutamyltransferase [Nitrospina watsonii]CAI2718607.1 Gamma-glutamyltransferase [Nitrospina watsonii]
MKLDKIETRLESRADKKSAIARKGMVSTAFPEATQAGVDILGAGGNAVDAAVAAALALGVCEPQASGLGGQSSGILYLNDKVIYVDGSSRAPSLAHIDQYADDDLLVGHRATTVPSTVAFLGYLNFRYGRMSWRQVLAPAIRIAREGYRITPLQSQLQERELEIFQKDICRWGARYFLKDGATPFQPGDLFVQKDLANLLEHLSYNGPNSFYQGEIAELIDADMRAHDGFVRKEDLAYIPWPVERRPIKRRYRKTQIYTCPPPTSGRTLLLVLQMLNNLPSKFLRERSPESYHFIAETFRKALMNHKERPYDPNIYPQLPDDKRILSKDYARYLSSTIRNVIDPSLPLVEPFQSGQDTTHLSVMDGDGNAIGITQSIERVYGSHAAADGLGFLYNNYMSALEVKDPSHPYYLRPGAVPWSSIAPVILFYKKQPWMVAGSPGSDRIFSTMSQFLSHIIDGNMPIDEAMIHPRLHCTLGGILSYEKERFPKTIIRYLKDAGYKMTPKDPYAFYLGAVHAVVKTQTRDGFQGVAEIRRDGTAAGID